MPVHLRQWYPARSPNEAKDAGIAPPGDCVTGDFVTGDIVTDDFVPEISAMPAIMGYPNSLSPSRTNDFLTCPMLYRLRTIDRLPEEPSLAAIRGTLVHRALEWLFDLPAPERTIEATGALLDKAWQELQETSPAEAEALCVQLAGSVDEAQADARTITTQILAPAEPLLRTYFAMEDPTRLDPAARELAVRAQLDAGLVLRGFVDRLDRNSNGDVRIVDYKTGRSPGSGFETKAMFQMRFYALTWWRMTGEIPRLLQLLYLGNSEVLRYQPDVDDLRATERKILAIRAAIAASADSGTFAPNPGRHCDWCSFRSVCPAWGALPIPLPDRSTWPATRDLETTPAVAPQLIERVRSIRDGIEE